MSSQTRVRWKTIGVPVALCSALLTDRACLGADGTAGRWWDRQWPYRIEVPAAALSGDETPRALFVEFDQILRDLGYESVPRFVSVQAVVHSADRHTPLPTVTHVKLETGRGRFGYVGYEGKAALNGRLFLYFKATAATPDEQAAMAPLLRKLLPWWVNLYPNPSIELGAGSRPADCDFGFYGDQSPDWVEGEASHGLRYLRQTKPRAGMNQSFRRLVRTGDGQWRTQALSSKQLAGETVHHKVDVYYEQPESQARVWIRCYDATGHGGWLPSHPQMKPEFSTTSLGRWVSAETTWTFPTAHFDRTDVCFPVTVGTRGDHFVAQLAAKEMFTVRPASTILFTPNDDEFGLRIETPSGRCLQWYPSKMDAVQGKGRDCRVAVVCHFEASSRPWDVRFQITSPGGPVVASVFHTGLRGPVITLPVQTKGLSPGPLVMSATIYEAGSKQPIFVWSSPARALPTPYAE